MKRGFTKKETARRVARLSDKDLRIRMAKHRAFHDRFGVFLEHDYTEMVKERMKRKKAMARYHFDLKKQAGKHEVKIASDRNYGSYEHDDYGDEAGGGLWFDDEKNLVDFDGMAVLPIEVGKAIIEMGYSVELESFCGVAE